MKSWPNILKAAGAFCLLCFQQLLSQQYDYFPMRLGDKWIYKLTSGGRHYANQIIIVTDTLTLNQKRYFIFEDCIFDIFYEPGRVYYKKHYYRKSADGEIMKYRSITNDEQLYYSFKRYESYLFLDVSATQGTQFQFLGTSERCGYAFGEYRPCATYSYSPWSNGHVAHTGWITLAADIGLVGSSREGDWNYIVGAYLNGVLFGDTTSTSVEQLHESRLPQSPAFHQNFPNPFYNATRLTYSVPSLWIEPVEISIFDLAGRELMRFAPQRNGAGTHNHVWDGRDKFGSNAGSGVYLARLKSGGYSQYIKIQLLK